MPDRATGSPREGAADSPAAAPGPDATRADRGGTLPGIPIEPSEDDEARRHSAMLAWLLRDHVSRLDRAGDSLAGADDETARLRRQLASLREAYAKVVDELERRRSLGDVGMLAAGMVHDFNNLLTVIAGHASVARVGDAEQRDLSLERIVQATQRAAELSRMLLRWARHDGPRPESLDVNALVSDVLDLLAPSAPARALLSRHLAEHLPRVTADAVDIRRIVLNLVTNAWQAIGAEQGEVTVRTGFDGERYPEVWLEVADDGRGMSPDVSARVFEPFFSTREGGSGLGLSTVQRIVDRLGGRIEVWSEPGRGARFRASLPAPPSA